MDEREADDAESGMVGDRGGRGPVTGLGAVRLACVIVYV